MIKGGRALVLGGGIAGLAAATVLARHFEEVTVVERDTYPAEPSVRAHTSHGAHLHILLAGGLAALSRLVPKLPSWFDEMGVREQDLTLHTRVAFNGRWLPKAPSGIKIRVSTRADIEHLLRRHVVSLSNVRVRDDHKVEGLIGRERILGARVSHGGATEEIRADLVVDSMGRGSPGTRWLEEGSGLRVNEETVDAGILYTSAWFQSDAAIDDDWALLATLPVFPDHPNLAAVARYPGGRLLCSHAVYGRPKPPRTMDEMVERTAGIGVPHIHRLLRASKPASDMFVYGNTQNRQRHFGALPWFPEGLLILGDAACCLDPRYGQGMTVAALGAERLDEELTSYFRARGGLVGFAHHFQKSLERTLAVPWAMAMMEDRGWASRLSGREPTALDRIALFGGLRVISTAASDIDTFIRLNRVAQLLDKPTVMMHPRTIAKIIMGGGGVGGPDDSPSVGAV